MAYESRPAVRPLQTAEQSHKFRIFGPPAFLDSSSNPNESQTQDEWVILVRSLPKWRFDPANSWVEAKVRLIARRLAIRRSRRTKKHPTGTLTPDLAEHLIDALSGGSMPTIHAWVTDGCGRAIDNTWSRAGVAYAGIPFQSKFVQMRALQHHAIISLLDDYRNGYPLRSDLGDRPDEWFERRGQGVTPLSVVPVRLGAP
jgi:hypothetical protein